MKVGLTKAKKFPTQNIQAVESLRYVISKGYKPSDVRPLHDPKQYNKLSADGDAVDNHRRRLSRRQHVPGLNIPPPPSPQRVNAIKA